MLYYNHNYGTIMDENGGAVMPHIIPIKDLKNTGAISDLCHSTNEPIFITKNGYGDMVIMSMKTYEEQKRAQHIYDMIEKSEEDFANGDVLDARQELKGLRNKYGL